MAKKTIKITEEELKRILNESISRVLEGIEVTSDRLVTMTDKHEKLVDTSAVNNPSVSDSIIPNIRVWSIFKRKEGAWNDGNPLLYALKGEKGYTISNEMKVKNRIEYITKKFLETNQGIDVTIMVPSANELNKYFASIVAKGCKNPQYIDNLLVKMSIQEVDDLINAPDSLFRKTYGPQYDSAHELLEKYYSYMKKGVFQFHLVQNLEMRKTIEHTIKLSDEFYGKYIDCINDKNVLIIDDSITFAQSLKESCKIIAECYTPKSITVLTLFSPLYDETGTKTVNI